jgi:DNA-binding CsgD family transcriptional regulator
MARDGASNQEIATQLFVSRKTVEYHLHKVYTKLGIGTREHLDRVLPGD